MRDVRIAAALVRRGDELLMVRQAGPGEQPAWSVPGGVVEPGELPTEALVREVREETGVRVLDPGRVAFTAHLDNRQDGWYATVWTWDVAAWDGELRPEDPDGFVREAAFVPLPEAIDRLAGLAWHALTVRHLRGDLDPGSFWQVRTHPGGRAEVSGPF